MPFCGQGKPGWPGSVIHSLLVAVVVATTGGWTWRADEPAAATAREGLPASWATPEDALREALELERKRAWAEAIEVYEKALKEWPTRKDFGQRLRLCETHYHLSRRYQDKSFRETLLGLSAADATRLYEELLEKIRGSYVDEVSFETLLRRGYDNLEVGLRDQTFLQVNAPGATEDRVKWLRDALRSERQQVRARTLEETKIWVNRSCELGRRALGISPTAVTLEFLFGACALDDYSGCLTPDRLADLYAEIDGNFVGIGVELKTSPRGLKVVQVLSGGPAAEGGLKAGDEIVAVEGHPIAGMAIDPAAALLQGPEGTRFSLTVSSPSGEERELTLERRPVTVLSVDQVTMLSGGVGYIRLSAFQKTSVEEMERAIGLLRSQGMTHLILDLRGNPGGLLNVAVDLADRFLDQGLIVSTRGRAPGQSYEYLDRGPAEWSMPATVLIDRDSASASEILAGALKEHRRAEIIGERSYGKGSVQSIFPLRTADAALKLTTARFYSPRNRPYSEQGVEPDVLARSAERPAREGGRPDPTQVLGDPESDPVLALSLRRAASSASARRP